MLNGLRWVAHKAWILCGIPIWCFTEDGPIGVAAGWITDRWLEIGDRIEGRPVYRRLPRR
jgi:hypothetical protein